MTFISTSKADSHFWSNHLCSRIYERIPESSVFRYKISQMNILVTQKKELQSDQLHRCVYLSYLVGSGLMASDTDLISGSGFSMSILSSSSSESKRLFPSSFRSSLLLLRSSRLLLRSSLLWFFLDLFTSIAFPQFPTESKSRKASRPKI